MLTYELLEKLEKYLRRKKIITNAFFSINYSTSEGYWLHTYESWELLALTGMAKYAVTPDITPNDEDIELANKIVKLLYESGDEDLKNIAWTTFAHYGIWDERFVLCKEITTACHKKGYKKNCNRTKDIGTDNLIIRRQNANDAEKIKEDSENCGSFIDFFKYSSVSDETEICFSLFLKTNNELIGALGFDFGPYPSGDKATIHYYLLEKYKDNVEYIKEALQAIINTIKERKFIIYVQKHRYFIYEEYAPDVQYLLIESIGDSSIVYDKLAKYLGFEFVGARLDDYLLYGLDEKDKTNVYVLKIKNK